MKRLILAAALLTAMSGGWAETIVCSYPAFQRPGKPPREEPVVVELKVDGGTADVRWAGKFSFPGDYQVLENTPYGLVISQTYAAREAEGAAPTIGMFTFLIDRKSGAMRYLGFFMNGNDLATARGACLFQK